MSADVITHVRECCFTWVRHQAGYRSQVACVHLVLFFTEETVCLTHSPLTVTELSSYGYAALVCMILNRNGDHNVHVSRYGDTGDQLYLAIVVQV